MTRGAELEVRWENHLTGPFPVVVTVAPEYAGDGTIWPHVGHEDMPHE